jgi:cyclic pyranopterin phosphate synthase
VIAGIDAAAAAGFGALKIDSVVMRGVNDDELADLLRFGRERGAEVRFIEYMDVGGATQWSPEKVVSRADMLERLAAAFGPIAPIVEVSSAPAERFRLEDGTSFGIIASTTAPFCRSCDRSRLTADGLWFLCLYATRGIDLRGRCGRRLGRGAPRILARGVGPARRPRRRGAAGLACEARAALPVPELKRDPHLEMHTRAVSRRGCHRKVSGF